MGRSLIQLEHVDVALDGETILRDITWQLQRGQHWAILGPNGSGKSTFLRLLRGELCPAPAKGRRTYGFDRAPQTSAVGIGEKIALVSPESQDRYLQQDWTLTGREVIYSGFLNTAFVYQQPNSRQKAFAESIVRLTGVEPLLRRNVQQLSTGELRKLLIARALAGRPRVLLLDEVCDGLDATSRARLLDTIEHVARNGTQILCTTHREEEIVPAIRHTLELQNGRIARQLGWGPSIRKLSTTSRKRTPHSRDQGRESRVESRRPSTHAAFFPLRMSAVPTARAGRVRIVGETEMLIGIERADVFLDGRKVLHGLTWEMRANQNWVFFGPNGAGKSTLVKLILGELHPATGGRVRRFDLAAVGTLWDVRERIGALSPEFQANYQADLTGVEVVASGFYSSIGLLEPPSRRQEQKARAWMNALGLGRLADKVSGRMSYGEFRHLLLLRALVHSPRILVCDEPFDGLDPEAKACWMRVLERVLRGGTRLIMVTHHPGELPEGMTHALLLEGGRIVRQGPLVEFGSK